MKISISSCCLTLICIVNDVPAQKYKGLRIINSKGKVYREQIHWDHELQLGVKFPNAQAVTEPKWLSGSNLRNYGRSLPVFSLSYYYQLNDRFAIGLGGYYDANRRKERIGNGLVQLSMQNYIAVMAQARIFWTNSSNPCRFYSAAAAGAGWRIDSTVRQRIAGSGTLVSVSGRRGNEGWQNYEYQFVLLGVLYGQKHLRAFGELGYGSLYLLKAGVAYTL